jgi:NAD(P)-dependent dehydrogenase (short-subunit alcohol dehydrogenase family)
VPIDGAVALVTGGGSGIGRATARLLAERGARVIVADVSEQAADATAAEIGPAASAVAADVTDPGSVEALLAAVADVGPLDIAVNNAGISGTFATLQDTTPADWHRLLDVNLTGVFLCLRAEIPVLLARGGGAIVNVASAAGMIGVPGMCGYSASKHGVVGLTRTAALENARKGIRVNAVLPGTVRTPMLEAFTGGSEQTLAAMAKGQPIGRLAAPEEIAETIVWLCSDASSYVTGHALAVDGGALAT